MGPILTAFLIGIGLSFIVVLGDALIKHASLQTGFSGWKFLLLGAIVYAITALGWFFVMRRIKLSTVAVLFSVSTAIFLVLVSVFYFKEKLSLFEIFGIFLAIVSLFILYRFN